MVAEDLAVFVMVCMVFYGERLTRRGFLCDFDGVAVDFLVSGRSFCKQDQHLRGRESSNDYDWEGRREWVCIF